MTESTRPKRVVIVDADNPLEEVHGEFFWREDHERILAAERQRSYAEGFSDGQARSGSRVVVHHRLRRRIGLRRTDIDFANRTISPSTPRVVVAGRAVESEAKTRSGERNLALDPDTLEALREYVGVWQEERQLLGQDTELLFVWSTGRPLHPDTITALFHAHCKAAGLPRIRLHDVRHSYATAALKAGIPAKVISERLGTRPPPSPCRTYTHVIPGMDEMAADTVARLILGPRKAETDGSILGSIAADEDVQESKEPADLLRFRRSAGPSSSSGGRI